MSNTRHFRRRLSPAQDAVDRLLGPLDGGTIPGGCDHCDAYQRPTKIAGGIWHIAVHHDDWCPMLADRKGTRS